MAQHGASRGGSEGGAFERLEDNDASFDVAEAVEHIGFGSYQVKLIIKVSFIWIADAAEIVLMGFLGPVCPAVVCLVVYCLFLATLFRCAKSANITPRHRPALKCLWGLSRVQMAALPSVIFVGMFFGANFWGWFDDR